MKLDLSNGRLAAMVRLGSAGRSRRVTRACALVALAVGATIPAAGPASSKEGAPSVRVLAFTKTAGFRHASIPVAVAALRELAARNGFAVDVTEDAAVFSAGSLARYDVVIFLLTTGDVLDERQQAAFARYIGTGGGYAGVHSATDTEYGWPWYGRLVGAYFKSHPAIQRAVITVADTRHPSTQPLPQRWVRTDEWYGFRSNPRGAVRVLATLDETSYDPGDGTMGADHPVAWSHEYAGGRAWYTAGGHTAESYAEPLFLAHLLGGIRYAAGPAAPQIQALTATVRGGRVAVTVRHATCRRCAAQLRVLGRGATVRMRDDGRSARASVTLPPGGWRLTVVLENLATGRKTIASRLVRVR